MHCRGNPLPHGSGRLQRNGLLFPQTSTLTFEEPRNTSQLKSTHKCVWKNAHCIFLKCQLLVISKGGECSVTPRGRHSPGVETPAFGPRVFPKRDPQRAKQVSYQGLIEIPQSLLSQLLEAKPDCDFPFLCFYFPLVFFFYITITRMWIFYVNCLNLYYHISMGLIFIYTYSAASLSSSGPCLPSVPPPPHYSFLVSLSRVNVCKYKQIQIRIFLFLSPFYRKGNILTTPSCTWLYSLDLPSGFFSTHTQGDFSSFVQLQIISARGCHPLFSPSPADGHFGCLYHKRCCS